MSHAKHALWAATAGLVVAALTACGMASIDAADGLERGSDAPLGDGGTSSKPGVSAAPPGAPTATGVILVHAAAFPAFRLCFSNFPDLVPQPNSRVMPEANVVGVDIGSVVRIDSLEAPGTVYVIRESEVRSTPGTATPKCGDLIREPGQETQRSLMRDTEYHVASTIDEPLGQNKVTVLAITGCGGNPFLTSLGATSASCGASWNVTSGNLEAKVFDLATTADRATDKTLPVQLFHLSPALEAFKGAAGSLAVTFGQLEAGTNPLAQPVTTGPLFAGGARTSLALEQSESSVYAAFGFRVTAASGASTFSIDQSLAAVQEFSSSRDLPTSYYRAASNYALLLLGDPAHKATLENGDPNPKFNPRQGVHILAVPVLDPEKADAGTDSGTPATVDGGT